MRCSGTGYTVHCLAASSVMCLGCKDVLVKPFIPPLLPKLVAGEIRNALFIEQSIVIGCRFFLPPLLPLSWRPQDPLNLSVPPCSSHVTLSSNTYKKTPILTPSFLFPAPSCHLPIADLCVGPPGVALCPHGLLARHTGCSPAASPWCLRASAGGVLCVVTTSWCPQLSFALATSSADPWCVCQATPPPGTLKP